MQIVLCFGDHVLDAQLLAQHGDEYARLYVSAHGDDRHIKVAYAECRQRLFIYGICLDRVSHIRRDIFDQLFIAVNRKDILAEAEKRFCDALAKTPHPNHNILFVFHPIPP